MQPNAETERLNNNSQHISWWRRCTLCQIIQWLAIVLTASIAIGALSKTTTAGTGEQHVGNVKVSQEVETTPTKLQPTSARNLTTKTSHTVNGKVYAHFIPMALQKTDKIAWDDYPSHSFSSHDVALRDNNTSIMFGVPGIYQISLTLLLPSMPADKRVQIWVLQSKVFLRKFTVGTTGTFYCSFLLKLFYKDSKIAFQFENHYKQWKGNHLEASLDIVQISSDVVR